MEDQDILKVEAKLQDCQLECQNVKEQVKN